MNVARNLLAGLVVAVLFGIALGWHSEMDECVQLGGVLGIECNVNLLYIAKDGDLAAIRRELDAGADVNEIDSMNFTALAWASRMGRAEAARMLLQRGANPNTLDALGGTPLTYAITACDEDPGLLELMIRKGAKLEMRDRDGTTPLSMAARVGNSEAVRVLLAAGADLQAKNMQGQTPLEIARLKVEEIGDQNIEPDPRPRYAKTIRLLLEAGRGQLGHRN